MFTLKSTRLLRTLTVASSVLMAAAHVMSPAAAAIAIAAAELLHAVANAGEDKAPK